MAIDRKLLWKAWPSGFLAMRGASTVGGWICVRTPFGCRYTNPQSWRFFAPSPVFQAGQHKASSTRRLEGDAAMEAVRCQGDLLPNVDPSDVATWACLLADLAETCLVLDVRANDAVVGLIWRLGDSGDPGVQAWELIVYALDYDRSRLFLIDTDDPAEALVLARIQLQGQGEG